MGLGLVVGVIVNKKTCPVDSHQKNKNGTRGGVDVGAKISASTHQHLVLMSVETV